MPVPVSGPCYPVGDEREKIPVGVTDSGTGTKAPRSPPSSQAGWICCGVGDVGDAGTVCYTICLKSGRSVVNPIRVQRFLGTGPEPTPCQLFRRQTSSYPGMASSHGTDTFCGKEGAKNIRPEVEKEAGSFSSDVLDGYQDPRTSPPVKRVSSPRGRSSVNPRIVIAVGSDGEGEESQEASDGIDEDSSFNSRFLKEILNFREQVEILNLIPVKNRRSAHALPRRMD